MTTLLVFGFDITEASQIRRIRLMQAAGFDVSSAAMRRDNMNKDFVPDWPNIELAKTGNAKMLSRLMAVFRSVKTMLGHRAKVRESDVLWARNFDLLLVAWLSRLFSGAKNPGPKLVYECLDIHYLFTRNDFIGRGMRAAERFLLRRIDLLIVSSPAFTRSYFEPQQKYYGASALIENKISFGKDAPARPVERQPRPRDSVPVIGWVGTLRCQPSFDLLLGLAAEMGAGVKIRMAGIVHEHMVRDFHERVAAHPNVDYTGAYDYPIGLTEIYNDCDFVWSQDMWQQGGNSDWLLPNRIYEASWNGCPSIALETTETGRYVYLNKLGFVLREPTPAGLKDCLAKNWPEAAIAMSNDLLSRDRLDFEQDEADVIKALQRA